MLQRFYEKVTPCAGVWIEIPEKMFITLPDLVTPCAGVWIEIIQNHYATQNPQSLPVRECGLKSLLP